MAAINFPNSPTNQQEHSENGVTYQYWSNTSAWLVVSNPSSGGSTYVESSPVSFTASTDATYGFAHGLGVLPDNFGWFMQCKVNNNGYVVGDRIDHPGFRSTTFLATLHADATEVAISFDAGPTNTLYFAPKGGGTAILPLTTDWDFVFWAETH